MDTLQLATPTHQKAFDLVHEHFANDARVLALTLTGSAARNEGAFDSDLDFDIFFAAGAPSGAIIAEVDEQWQPIPGTEQRVECDTICLSAGLKPSTELLEQAKIDLAYTGELGGWVAKRNWSMRTSNPDLFAAGDASGVEEASTAMMEGKIAGLQAAYDLGHTDVPVEEQKETRRSLDDLRAGPFGAKICIGLKCVEVLE